MPSSLERWTSERRQVTDHHRNTSPVCGGTSRTSERTFAYYVPAAMATEETQLVGHGRPQLVCRI